MSHAPTAALERRHQHVRDACAAGELDALIVTSLPNVLYLTNFTGSSAIAVVTPSSIRFVTDFRYVTMVTARQQSPQACPGFELTTVRGSYEETLAELVAGSGWRRVGFEAAQMTVAQYDALRTRTDAAHGPALIPTENLLEQYRIVKDDYEIETLREAGRRLSAVARALTGDVRPGRTEAEVALAIDNAVRQAGFQKAAFDTIVASGPNGALPHARPGNRKLSEGDLVVLDFGGVYDSYCVDLTRTVSIGRATSEARRVYDAVREAHDRAVQAVAPGVEAWQVDAAARDYLASQGLGEAFGHGTGHGLGIEVHETPRVSRRRPDAAAAERLAPGMIFTIEPGAYLPDWGGVRIEDDVLVTAAGVELLTDAPTGLIEI